MSDPLVNRLIVAGICGGLSVLLIFGAKFVIDSISRGLEKDQAKHDRVIGVLIFLGIGGFLAVFAYCIFSDQPAPQPGP